MPNTTIKTMTDSIHQAGVLSVSRAIQLLQFVCASTDASGLTLTQLSGLVGLSKPSVYRIMNTLQGYGLVLRDRQSARYQPGPSLIRLAASALESLKVRRQAREQLDYLSRVTGETVHLGILDGWDVVYVDKRESTRVVRMYSEVGRHAPVHCTALGKAVLAHLPPEKASELARERGLVRYTQRTITALGALRRELSEVRRRGYAVDNGEFELDTCCVGSPVFDHTGSVVAALSVSVPAFRVGEAMLQDLASEVKTAAARLSWALGAPQLAGGQGAGVSPRQSSPTDAGHHRVIPPNECVGGLASRGSRPRSQSVGRPEGPPAQRSPRALAAEGAAGEGGSGDTPIRIACAAREVMNGRTCAALSGGTGRVDGRGTGSSFVSKEAR